ncbi:hypothetical protein DyAD56_00405 [Dyella sp. AD56]|nr:hypothetical protein DyAD56_00405 [Dyella sp. AD56]
MRRREGDTVKRRAGRTVDAVKESSRTFRSDHTGAEQIVNVQGADYLLLVVDHQ